MDVMSRVIYSFSRQFCKKGQHVLLEYKWMRCFNFEFFKIKDILMFSFGVSKVIKVKSKISYLRE